MPRSDPAQTSLCAQGQVSEQWFSPSLGAKRPGNFHPASLGCFLTLPSSENEQRRIASVQCIDRTHFCPQNSTRTPCKAQHHLEHVAWRKTLQLCISPGLLALSYGLLAPSPSHLSHLLSQLSLQSSSLLSRNISETSLQLQWVKLRQEYAGDLRRR